MTRQKARKSPANKAIVAVRNSAVDPMIPFVGSVVDNASFWRWGGDNLFPYALSLLARRSTAHRRIINDKADYISGRGFNYDEKNLVLEGMVENANGQGESLRGILNKLALDKCMFGNAYLEIVTDHRFSFLSFYHQDATKCRLSKDKKRIVLHQNWMAFQQNQAKELPLYPQFADAGDGTRRSIIHYKDYEPMFENYGVPSYIAGLNVSAIAYKTDKWNISRLDNSFQLSGVMIIDGNMDSEEDALELKKKAQEQFAGKPGQVMFLIKDMNGSEGSKFVPVSSSNEGDWEKLHDQANTDIVVAHSWFRSLSGLDYSTGFSPERILHEYEVALNTVIRPEQANLLEPIINAMDAILGIDSSSLEIVNRPPIQQKPAYIKIWEARKIDGLDYDESDPAQQAFLATLTRAANGTNNASGSN